MKALVEALEVVIEDRPTTNLSAALLNIAKCKEVLSDYRKAIGK